MRFLGVAAAAAVVPRAARATGGLDIESAADTHVMRVLLAIDPEAPAEQTESWRFAWDGREYRGTAAVVPLGDGRQGLVNTLPLDAYLYGVLAKEISPSWPHAAQQAQAIVARTYALGRIKPARAYDVVASESDQQYAGIAGESEQGRAAIDATAATIVTYLGTPAHVAYSACCGGRTADAGDTWNTPYSYLRSIVDPYCANAPNFAWNADVSQRDIETTLPACANVGNLRSVEINVAGPGERPSTITIAGDGSRVDVTPKAFRNALGASVIRSTFVHTASIAGATLEIAGTGRGHGVGLCQWGARGLAQAGAGAKEILAFYLAGTDLGRI